MLHLCSKKEKKVKDDERPSLPGVVMNIRCAFIMKSTAVPKLLEWCRQQGIKRKMESFNERNGTYCLLQPLRYSRSAKITTYKNNQGDWDRTSLTLYYFNDYFCLYSFSSFKVILNYQCGNTWESFAMLKHLKISMYILICLNKVISMTDTEKKEFLF